MRKNKDFIPALKFNFLTKLFDFFLNFTMPEKTLKLDLIKQANIDKTSNVLDFGCGTGTLLIMLRNIFKGTMLFGVDVDKKVLDIAQSKIIAEKLDINLNQYDGLILPYTDNSFDVVFSSLVFHHLTREQKLNAYKEIYRVLKQDGELHILDFGKAPNILIRIYFLFWQLLDGFPNTNDNIIGLLPELAIKSGFSKVAETKRAMTVFGPLSYYSIKK